MEIEESIPRKKKRMTLETLQTHMQNYYFDPNIVSAERIGRWIAANPKCADVWKSCKITIVQSKLDRQQSHEMMWKMYKEQIYKFLTDMRESESDPTEIDKWIAEKAKKFIFFRKFQKHLQERGGSKPSISTDYPESDHVTQLDISGVYEHDNPEIRVALGNLARNYQRDRKYEVVKHDITLLAQRDSRYQPYLTFFDDPKSFVLFLLKNPIEYSGSI